MRPPEVNLAKLAMLFAKEFRLCNTQPGEPICMITDLNSPPEYVAAAFAAADELGADVYCPPQYERGRSPRFIAGVARPPLTRE